MDIKVIAADVTRLDSPVIVLECFEGGDITGPLAAVDKALGGAVSGLVKDGEIKGKAKEITLIHTLGKMPSPRVVVVGLGKPADLTVSKIRGAAAETCRWLRSRRINAIATLPLGAGVNGISAESAAQAVTEGAILGLYTFRKHITKKDDDQAEVKELTVIGSVDSLRQLEQGSARGKVLASAASQARDMVNEPANFMTPTHLAEAATELARANGLDVTILDREDMVKLGMGALLGVAQGSQQPPRFIILNYKGGNSGATDVGLVGKAITFDSGGISLKPSEGMSLMKGDKAGGVAVLMAMVAIARLKPAMNVSAYIPATENMPGGSALKPGDILTTMIGQTVEIISTDAEGRLILADALAYARKQGVKTLIDVATLTGACRQALGDVCSGAFGNNQGLMDKALAAGRETGELLWQFPMYDDYKEQLKSEVADLRNTGTGYGGAITAAKFLAEFAGSTPWLHLDIAGTSFTDKERAHLVKGATGVPVRTLVQLVLSLAKSQYITDKPKGG